MSWKYQSRRYETSHLIISTSAYERAIVVLFPYCDFDAIFLVCCVNISVIPTAHARALFGKANKLQIVSLLSIRLAPRHSCAEFRVNEFERQRCNGFFPLLIFHAQCRHQINSLQCTPYAPCIMPKKQIFKRVKKYTKFNECIHSLPPFRACFSNSIIQLKYADLLTQNIW